MFFKKKKEESAGVEAPKKEETVKDVILKWLKRLGLAASGIGLVFAGWKFRGAWDSIGKAVVEAVPDALPEAGPAVIEAAADAVETVVEEQL